MPSDDYLIHKRYLASIDKEVVAAKEKDRQYHMDAINRLASFLGFSGTSFEVVRAAMDNMTRMANELSALRSNYVNRCPHEWYQGRCIHCDVKAVNGRPEQ